MEEEVDKVMAVSGEKEGLMRTVEEMKQRLREVEAEVQSVLEHEKIEKEVRLGMMEANKAENLLVHGEEISARPKRTWFQTEYEKKANKLKSLNEGKQEEEEERGEEKEKKTKKRDLNKVHSLTRTKRRRIENREISFAKAVF